MSWWMWALMAMATIGFWVVVALVVKELFTPGTGSVASPMQEPLRLLDERLARGEIDAEQYVQARQLLTQGH